MAKVFISYKRNAQPDEPFARTLFEQLRAKHQPFIDQEILVGEAWAARIKQEIENADYLVLLISKHSIESGMVVEEIKIAETARQQNDHPKLLPVRLACDLFQTDLCQYPGYKDMISANYPWLLDTSNPCLNDEYFPLSPLSDRYCPIYSYPCFSICYQAT